LERPDLLAQLLLLVAQLVELLLRLSLGDVRRDQVVDDTNILTASSL
jgi:hypothetical protein